MISYDLDDLYWKLKDEPESREEVLEYYRTADIEEKMIFNHLYYI